MRSEGHSGKLLGRESDPSTNHFPTAPGGEELSPKFSGCSRGSSSSVGARRIERMGIAAQTEMNVVQGTSLVAGYPAVCDIALFNCH